MAEKAGSVQRKEEACLGPDAGLEGLRARVSDCGDPVYLKPGGLIRLRRPRILHRMTTRRWMIAVAVLGLVFAGWRGWYILSSQDRKYASIARFHRERESEFRARHQEARARLRSLAEIMDAEARRRPQRSAELARLEGIADELDQAERREARLVDYHAMMARKYERAALYPWLPVEPDPTEPGW